MISTFANLILLAEFRLKFVRLILAKYILDLECRGYIWNLLSLLKYGTEPSMESRGSLKDEKIGLISWNVDILNWIRACISDKATINKAPIREILLQFETAIEEFTLQTKKGELMEIENLLKTQSDIENAYSIAQALKNTLLSRFKEKLEEELTKIKPLDDNSQDNNEWNLGYKLSFSEDKS